MLRITPTIVLDDAEIEIRAIRAQGAGGQNVNKVSSAVHLRFDIPGSSLPDPVKQRLLRLTDQRITADGVVVIKAQSERSLEANKADALTRLRTLISSATRTRKQRVPTKPSLSARRKRVDHKTRRGRTKALRGKVDDS